SEWPFDAASVPFHPLFGYGLAAIEAVGGPALDDIQGKAVEVPTLGAYVPQIRCRPALRRRLPRREAYGLRLDQILGHSFVRTAAEIRRATWMPSGVALLLFCFA